MEEVDPPHAPVDGFALAEQLSVSGLGPNHAFQAVLDAVPGSWFFTRRNGTFAYANLGACAALGYTRDELQKKTVFDIDPTIQPAQWEALWEGTRPRDTLVVRTTHRTKNGVDFPVEVRASRLMLDGEDLAASYAIDVTQSENTKSALLETEAQKRRLLAAIEQAVEAVVVTDAQGIVEYVNPAYVATSRRDENDAIGKAWQSLEVGADADFLERLERALSRGETWAGRIKSLREDGEPYAEDVTVGPIRDDHEAIVGCVAVKRDITERIVLEEQLRQAQKMEAIGRLAGGVAHDFNNLLFVIQGNVQMLRQGTAKRADEMLGQVACAAERAGTLVQQLLTFSRKGTVDFVPVRLDRVVDSLQEMLRRLLGAHVRLQWEEQTGPITVQGNVGQLEQLIVNLCVNARDAMPNGGSLRLALERVDSDALPARMLADPAPSYARLTISDDGEGMTEDVQTHLFEPFFTTKGLESGTGLGLATVYAIVKNHNGFIDVQSAPGAGSTFYVSFPERPAVARTREQPPSRRSVVDGAGRRVLVAEDEPAVREITAAFLAQAGFEVVTACDGIEAESLLQASPSEFTVLVLDAVMPRRGGQAVYAALRQRGVQTPVLFVTGYDYELLQSLANSKGVAILQKPFDGARLIEQIGDLLSTSANGAFENS